MTPEVREIVEEVAAASGVNPELIVKPCRIRAVVTARREVMMRLHALGKFSSAQIGRFLNHDHTTVLFSIGRLKRKPPRPQWRTPYIMHLHCQGCRRCYFPEDAPTVQRPVQPLNGKRYLIPYAGADSERYIWRLRP